MNTPAEEWGKAEPPPKYPLTWRENLQPSASQGAYVCDCEASTWWAKEKGHSQSSNWHAMVGENILHYLSPTPPGWTWSM